MNILIITIFLGIFSIAYAKVEVIPVMKGWNGDSHAETLTKTINLKEEQGCVFFFSTGLEGYTYLYFRCQE